METAKERIDAGAWLRELRVALRVSQSRLARLSGVSRFRICTHALGDTAPTAEDQRRIRESLQSEAERLRNTSVQIDLVRPPAVAGAGASRD
jgi:predicted transcriptional regulator